MKCPIILLILSFLLCSPNNTQAQLCTTDNRFTEEEYFSETEIFSRTNIRYARAMDWQGNMVNLKMDVYFPKLGVDPLAERPFVMMIHGGGFKGGSKESMTNYCMEFAKRGFVAITINYRLGWDQSDPSDQVLAVYRAQQDANAALRFVVANANQARIDTDWLFIGGSSAGSVTSLSTIYVSQEEWEAEVPGITALLGPLNTSGNNLTNSFELQGIFNNWGMTLDNAINPEDMVPSIAFHGVLDQTTPIGTGPGYPGGPIYSGSGTIHNYLLANNVCSELTVDSMGFHGIYRGNDGEDFRVSRAACFFKSLFCEDCSSNYFVEQVLPDCAPNESEAVGIDVPKINTNTKDSTTPFRLFPNPVDAFLNIEGDLEGYEIELINTTGQVVRRMDYHDGSHTMNVADLTPGLYLFRAIHTEDKKVEVKKVLIQ
ncbi:MAG: alpha/beta hydrolase fold domain-containing protein [Bacteroidota bacterium]